MAMTRQDFWNLVSKDEGFLMRLDLAVARWINAVTTGQLEAKEQATLLKFALKSPANPRPFSLLIRWTVAGAEAVRTAEDPLDEKVLDDDSLYTAADAVLRVFAAQGLGLDVSR